MRTGSVNLGQGFPDRDGPPEVIAEAMRGAAARAQPVRARSRCPAAPAGDRPPPAAPLRDRARPGQPGRRDHRLHRGQSPPRCWAWSNPGDEVVVLEPYYDSYVAMIQMAGGVRRPVTLRAPDFRLDVDALRAAVTPATRFVLLNSPHNPTGAVLTVEELQAVADRRHRARPRRDHRRGLRAPHLRRRRARADRDPARHVRADPHPVQRREVLLVHRLEGGLGDRAGRAGRRRCSPRSSG